ncbi:MAG: hypothetical protein OXI59_08405, partial [Gemmatimonadota bacterium]|nr:hypothetical protein [Gemmatimonadota bacterium]
RWRYLICGRSMQEPVRGPETDIPQMSGSIEKLTGALNTITSPFWEILAFWSGSSGACLSYPIEFVV